MSLYWYGRPLMSLPVSSPGWNFPTICVAMAINSKTQRVQKTNAQNSATIFSDSMKPLAIGLSLLLVGWVRLQVSWSYACTRRGLGSVSWNLGVVSEVECFGARAGLGGFVSSLEAVLVRMTAEIAISQALTLSLPLPTSSTATTYFLPTAPATHQPP